jgi:3-hydroxyisobutyrate dehydrogenase
MATIGFLGLGNMGGPMAKNLVAAGHRVTGYDPVPAAMESAKAAGIQPAATPAEAAWGAEAVITMLPAGSHVKSAYLGEQGLLAGAPRGTLFIDSSTIDVGSAKVVHEAAEQAGQDFLDAPVSGGVAGAEGATLTFMCGGSETAFGKAKPLLDKMGRNVIHAGGGGAGQAAKVCNNMILGISMIAISEAFALAEKLGLDPAKLHDISSKSSGSCWAMLNHNPVPGLVPTAAANRDYKPGFAAALMLKDLKLALEAANQSGASIPLGAEAAQLYNLFVGQGHGGLDYSAIFKLVKGGQP